MRAFAVVVLVVAQWACADLPPGWEDAEPLEVRQSACAGDAYANEPPALAASRAQGRIQAVYDKAHFRCEQQVAGFLRRDAATWSVLFQPEDMNPSSVVRCDCLYRLEASFDATDTSPRDVVFFRRSDRYGGDDSEPEVVEAGRATAN